MGSFADPTCLFAAQITWHCIKLGVFGVHPYFVTLFEEEYFEPLKENFRRLSVKRRKVPSNFCPNFPCVSF